MPDFSSEHDHRSLPERQFIGRLKSRTAVAQHGTRQQCLSVVLEHTALRCLHY